MFYLTGVRGGLGGSLSISEVFFGRSIRVIGGAWGEIWAGCEEDWVGLGAECGGFLQGACGSQEKSVPLWRIYIRYGNKEELERVQGRVWEIGIGFRGDWDWVVNGDR